MAESQSLQKAGEATGEGTVSAAVEILRYWRCPACGLSSMARRAGMERGRPEPGRNVCVMDGRAEAEPTYDSQSPGVTSKHQMLDTEIFTLLVLSFNMI